MCAGMRPKRNGPELDRPRFTAGHKFARTISTNRETTACALEWNRWGRGHSMLQDTPRLALCPSGLQAGRGYTLRAADVTRVSTKTRLTPDDTNDRLAIVAPPVAKIDVRPLETAISFCSYDLTAATDQSIHTAARSFGMSRGLSQSSRALQPELFGEEFPRCLRPRD